MLKALVFKELRETIGIATIALLAHLAVIGSLAGYQVLPFLSGAERGIPFLALQYTYWFCFISVGFSVALGLWQTVVESARGTWLVLLHRPMALKKLIGIKLAIGTGVYLVVSASAILIYAAWAATPGTHASPFYWWMTVMYWRLLIVIALGYLGAFLAGIRPGRWIGTRLLPLLVAGILAAFIAYIVIELRWVFWGFMVFALVCSIFISLIFFVTRTRDFS